MTVPYDKIAVQTQNLINKFKEEDDFAFSLMDILSDEETLRNQENRFKTLQKKFLLESYGINKFHREYKDLERHYKDSFIVEQVRPYNSKLAEMGRLNNEVERLSRDLLTLKNKITLPSSSFSSQAVVSVLGSSAIANLSAEKQKKSFTIKMEDIFSLDPDSGLPTPDYDKFKELLDLEFKMRIDRRATYDILTSIKQQIMSQNIKWATKDSELNNFINTKLMNVIKDVQRVRAVEHETAKGEDYEESDETSELEDPEEDADEPGELDEPDKPGELGEPNVGNDPDVADDPDVVEELDVAEEPDVKDVKDMKDVKYLKCNEENATDNNINTSEDGEIDPEDLSEEKTEVISGLSGQVEPYNKGKQNEHFSPNIEQFEETTSYTEATKDDTEASSSKSSATSTVNKNDNKVDDPMDVDL